jgi:hypothetical protein
VEQLAEEGIIIESGIEMKIGDDKMTKELVLKGACGTAADKVR